MNESNLPNNENKKSDEWKSWPPEDFLSNLAHELRTPLILISGYAEILSDETRKELHPKALENISPYINRFLSPDTIIPDPSNPQDLNRFSYVRNNPLRYVDPTGHVCSDPDDPTPSCDGSGGTPPNLPAPLPDAPVVITNPGPLDDGQEQDDPTPTSSLDPHDDGNTLPIDPLTTTTPVTQTPSPSGPNWYTIAAGVAVVAISLVAISLIVAGVIITGGTAAGIAIIAGEMLLSTEIWLFISITAGSMYVGYQGIQLIGEGIEGK